MLCAGHPVSLIAAALIPVTLWPPYTNAPPIRSDGLGYHIWTRALLEQDFSFCKYRWPLMQIGAISREDAGRGVCQNKFPPGLALIRFPVMAPLVDRTPGALLVSKAEHQANLILSALVLLGICIFCLRSAQLLSVRPWSAHCAVVALVFGTGMFHYATYDASFTHIYSALGLTLLLFLGLRAQVLHSSPPLLATAAIAFFLVLIRSTNLVMLTVLLAGYLLWTDTGRTQRTDARRTPAVLKDVVSILTGVAAGLALQLVYNRYASGEFSLSSYGHEGFLFARPMHLAVLLSYERGLFTYYPVLALVLASGLTVPRTRRAALWFTSLLAAYTGIYGFWHSWMLGGGFGHRGFVEIIPFGIVLFAVVLSDMRGYLHITAVALVVISVFMTIELMVGYWSGTLPFGGTTRQVYWSHVLTPHCYLPVSGCTAP